MKRIGIPMIGFALAILGSAPVRAQQTPPTQANPSAGCGATPAQLEANKRVAEQFFLTTGEARVALADPSYKQHNPAFKKRAEDEKISDYEEFKNTFLGQAGRGRGPATGPTPPQGNPFEIVTAECDIVTIVHRNYRQDPTADPGTFYEVFTFDTFRIREGKLVEHWDGAVINPPGGAGGAAPGRAQ